MSDNEIIKALEYCGSHHDCRGCPRFGINLFSSDCIDDVMLNALGLINRQKEEKEALIAGQESLQKHIAEQKAEIERLNVELVGMRGACESFKFHYENAQTEIRRLQDQFREVAKKVKVEARKEFAEIIKQSTTDKSIDELLEEMERKENE